MSLANIFMLAHAVLPHYHHDGVVCFDSKTEVAHNSCGTYSQAKECCDASDANAHHRHLDSCNLSQMIERNGHPSEDLVTLSPSLATFLVCVCSLECYNLLALADIAVDKFERYKPYLDTYNSPYVGSSFGLRAPPCSIIS